MNISINSDYCEKEQKDEVKNKEIPTSASNTCVVKAIVIKLSVSAQMLVNISQLDIFPVYR